jgi:dienelactone hydrolase
MKITQIMLATLASQAARRADRTAPRGGGPGGGPGWGRAARRVMVWASGLVAWLVALHSLAWGMPQSPPAAAGPFDAGDNSPAWGFLGADPRLGEPRSLDSYFPFQAPTDLESWSRRRERLQANLRTVLGLDPEPPRGPLNVVISPPLERDGYSVAKVRFESLPGFFVTGSLYRPLPAKSDPTAADASSDAAAGGVPERRPAILCPHGHWSRGRFMWASDQEVQRELDSGAEIHESAARSPLQARCVHLARMGAVVFHYDMLGNADSVQIPAGIAHGFARQREHLNAPDAWGLFSVRAESYFQSIMGLQTWNTIRSLDFLETLPDVDPQRIAVTGASGGGTQTFMVAALDPRVQVAFPAVMVGTAMQGGCVCENCSLLRVEGGNVEIAALFAPKPQGLTAADDWTKEMATKGFPELQQLYALYGAADNVELTSRLEFGHNYNRFGREAMYRLMARHFELPDFPERPFQLLRDYEMSWLIPPPAPAAKEASDTSQTTEATEAAEVAEATEAAAVAADVPPFEPATGEAFEIELLQAWRMATEQAWRERLERIHTDRADVDGWLGSWQARLRDLYLGRDYRLPTDLHWLPISGHDLTPTIRRSQWLLIDRATRQCVPVVVYDLIGVPGRPLPHEAPQICLYLGDQADAILDQQGQLPTWATERLTAGQRIMCIDLLGQGRFVTGAKFQIDDRWRMTQRESAGYVLGYNLPLVGQRAQDVLQVLAMLSPSAVSGAEPEQPATRPRVDVVAEGAGVPVFSVAALALSDSGDGSPAGETLQPSPNAWEVRLGQVELRDGDFRFVDVPTIRGEHFLPGVAVVGDLPGLWRLNRLPRVIVRVADVDGSSGGGSWAEVNRTRAAVGSPPLQVQPGGDR